MVRWSGAHWGGNFCLEIPHIVVPVTTQTNDPDKVSKRCGNIGQRREVVVGMKQYKVTRKGSGPKRQ